MGIMKKFKDLVGMDETEFDDDGVYLDDEVDEDEEPHTNYAQPAESAKKSKVVSINTASQLQVVLVKPEQFENAREIADHLNAKKTVVLNLESTNKDISKRLIDFLTGVAYANSGRLQKIASNTFIITPYNVDMKGEIMDELESNGIFF